MGAKPTSGSMLTDFWKAVWACQQPEFTARTLWYLPYPSLWTWPVWKTSGTESIVR
jgi:hypothetical protein